MPIGMLDPKPSYLLLTQEQESKCFFIEMMLRCSGDLHSRLVELLTHFDNFGNCIKTCIYVYIPADNFPKTSLKIKCARHTPTRERCIPRTIQNSEYIGPHQTRPFNKKFHFEKHSLQRNIFEKASSLLG